MPQQILFGQRDAPACDPSFQNLERIELADGAWIERVRGWLKGHEWLFDYLQSRVIWDLSQRVMYDDVVTVPRLHASGDVDLHPVLADMQSALNRRYGTDFVHLSFALYRNGRDSVAWHGDYTARQMNEALGVTVSVGNPRKFSIRHRGGGRSHSLSLGWGDLLVMGGSFHRTHEHCVPKVAHADPRIAIMYRPEWKM